MPPAGGVTCGAWLAVTRNALERYGEDLTLMIAADDPIVNKTVVVAQGHALDAWGGVRALRRRVGRPEGRIIQ